MISLAVTKCYADVKLSIDTMYRPITDNVLYSIKYNVALNRIKLVLFEHLDDGG